MPHTTIANARREVRPKPPLDMGKSRPSFLDPNLPTEPWLDECEREQLLVLFLLNRPIALMSGSSLDHVSMMTLLNQLRQRCPRKIK